MAMGTERSNSKALHNFSMPRLKWGNQRFLRCVKLSSEEEEEEEEEAVQQHNSLSFHNSNDIEAVREKLMIDLRVATDKLKGSIFEEGNLNPNPNPNPNPSRPWNLRTPRASCTNLFNSLAQTPNDNANNKKKKMNEKRPKFCVSLSKGEIEQDFCALVGTRPPRRPKKRPRILQNQMDTLFPGLWLSEVTAESYKVPDVPE